MRDLFLLTVRRSALPGCWDVVTLSGGPCTAGRGGRTVTHVLVRHIIRASVISFVCYEYVKEHVSKGQIRDRFLWERALTNDEPWRN